MKMIAFLMIFSPFQGIRIVSLHIRSEVQYRFATTHVTSSLLNEDLKDKEAVFDVTLPEAAFISNFSLQVYSQSVYMSNTCVIITARYIKYSVHEWMIYMYYI